MILFRVKMVFSLSEIMEYKQIGVVMLSYNALNKRLEMLETKKDDERDIEADCQFFDQALQEDESGNYTGRISQEVGARCSQMLVQLLGFAQGPDGFFIQEKLEG